MTILGALESGLAILRRTEQHASTDCLAQVKLSVEDTKKR